MNQETSFGQIVKERRTALGLTQAELARRVGCAAITIRKIEADALRPSVQVAELLAIALNIPEKEQLAFIRLARTDLGPSPIPTPAPSPEEIGREDLSGRAIRGFHLGELIGTGGFGVVYKAVQTTVEREVAVKIILPKYANHPDFIRRFEFEAQLVARLEHPFVVPLYDYWREPDAAYLIMRLLRGGSLESVLKHGSLSLEQANQFVQQIGLALHAAHRAGVIHRDIKPANILLDDDGNAYLADFGIAKDVVIANGNRTEIGGMVGSPAYISPEQIRAEPVKPQADIYCLGIMLFELLTGRKPFAGPTPVAYIQQHLLENLPSLLSVNPALPPHLDQVIQRATAKNPGDRYPDMLALLADFHQALPTDGVILPATEAFMPELSTQELAALANPFKGLRPFYEADAANFYGRDTLIQELLTRLSESDDLARFLAVVGPSGSGKSSVVRAGLIPALRRGGLPGSDNWFIIEMMPGSHPFEEVEAALLRIAVNPPESLLGQLREDQRGLLRAVQRVLPADPDVELLLVIDQFEELFTLVSDETSRAQFLDSLVEAVLDKRSRLRLVVTLRADFVDRPLQYVDFGELVRKRAEFVLPLTPDELEQAITRPVSQLGMAVEPELVAHMVREVGDQPGTLPLLQYALTELFERRTGGMLTRELYESSGGVLGALGRRAEEIYNSLDVAAQVATKQLCLRLITLGEGVEDTRRRILRSELLSLGDPHRPRFFIEHPLGEFGKYRLLTFGSDPLTREPTVEVAHEALLREWGRLRQWLDESRADVRLQRLLALAANEWQAADQDDSYLLRGSRLDQFEGWAATTDMALTQEERAFLQASSTARQSRQAAEEARRQRELETAQRLAETERQRAEVQVRAARRLRQFVVGLALFLVIALGATWFALVQRNTAQENFVASERIRLASQAQIALDRGEEATLPALLALRSLQLGYSPEADAALQNALRRGFARQQYPGQTGIGGGGELSPDGRTLATSSSDQAVHLWDVQTGVELRQFPGDGIGVTWSPDGRLLSTISFDGTISIWDVQSGREVQQFTGYADTFGFITFSPDSHLLATTNQQEQSVYIFDVVSGDLIQTVIGHFGVWWVQFSPDGQMIVTTGPDGVARVWDVNTGVLRQTYEGHTGYLDNAWFSADGRYLVTASEDQTARIWDVASGRELRRFVGHTDIVHTATFAPDGRFLVTGSEDKTIRLWDIGASQEVRQFLGHTAAIGALDFTPDGRYLFSTSDDGTGKLWDIAGETEPRIYLFRNILQHFVRAIAQSPDGQLAAAFTGGNVRFWNEDRGEFADTLVTRLDTINTMMFSPDGRFLLLGSQDGSARLWDVVAGTESGHFQADEEPIYTAIFASNANDILTGSSDGTIRLWAQENGASLWQFDGHTGAIRALALAPDGQTFLSASDDGTVKLWLLASGEIRHTLSGHNGPVLAATFSPDGRFVLTGGADNVVYLWDAATGEQIRRFAGHTDQITQVAFAPDGSSILTGSVDQTARLWHVQSGAVQRVFAGHEDTLLYANFTADGQQIITSDAAALYQWRRTLEAVISFACDQLPRDFSEAERTFYDINDQNPTCPQLAEEVAQIEPTWTPIAPGDLQPAPLLLAQEIEFINAEMANLGMAAPTQQVYIPGEAGEVVRSETLAGNFLDMPLFASTDVITEPFDLGPFPIGNAIGATLGEYIAAGGGGTYTVLGSRALLDLSFHDLVPNGVYTLWCVKVPLISAAGALEELPCGAPDGSENEFVANVDGSAQIALEIDAFPPSTEEVIHSIVTVFHSDDQTYGELPGEFGTNAHIQLFYDFWPPE